MPNRIYKRAVDVALLSLMTVALSATTAYPAFPGLIRYQGRITTSTGVPIADGAYLIKFQIYESAVGGVALWNSNYQSVQVKDGVYTYVLGQDVPFPNGLFTGGDRWLGVTVGVDPEMTPRNVPETVNEGRHSNPLQEPLR